MATDKVMKLTITKKDGSGWVASSPSLPVPLAQREKETPGKVVRNDRNEPGKRNEVMDVCVDSEEEWMTVAKKPVAGAPTKGASAARKSPETAVRLSFGEATGARVLGQTAQSKKATVVRNKDGNRAAAALSGAAGARGSGGAVTGTSAAAQAAATAAAEQRPVATAVGPAMTAGATAEKAATRSGDGAARATVEMEAQQRRAAGAEAKAAAAPAAEQGAESASFDKDLTVVLELQGDEPVSALELMRAVRGLCGGLVACRATGARTFEVTMSHTKGKERLLDGFKIGQTAVLAKALCNDELVVSFLNLPAYITDEEIFKKLDSWGVTAASAIRRRMWPGTRIADGTRFLKVKFTDRVQSLPYSARFETALGPEYFRVIHDRQVKVCRMCLQPGHILRECPEFACHRCGVQGHYARECGQSTGRKNTKEKCAICMNNLAECTCQESPQQDSEMSSGELLSEGDESSEGEAEEDGREAGVAGMADLAWAGPGAGQGGTEGQSGSGEIGSGLDDRCPMELGLPESCDFELPPGQGQSVTAGPAVRKKTAAGEPPGAVPGPPLSAAPITESSDCEMDVEAVKAARRLSSKKQKKKKMKSGV